MKTSPFKIVFWTLAAILAAAFSGVLIFFIRTAGAPNVKGNFHVFTFSFVLAFAVIIIGLLTLIAILVFRDAKKRGLNPWLWAMVATFVPNFLGLILYLIVRYTVKKPCPHCGRGLQGNFNICPYCGTNLKLHCPECGEDVLEEWKVCPHCGYKLDSASAAE
ncbi:MAG: zinc ribbon domain-containing protein [Acidobacteria bacterium]|nr:zinc ribbon domain-containing protein [Acidobacteriota bacterium]